MITKVINEQTIQKICRDISWTLIEEQSGFVSAQESNDPTNGASQIIRAHSKRDGMISVLRDIGIECEITDKSITLYQRFGDNEVIAEVKR